MKDHAEAGPCAFRWRLRGDRLPGFALALRLGEGTRSGLLRAWEAAGNRGFSDSFHANARWLPEDLDGDGRIDHMLLFTEQGIPRPLLPHAASGARIFLSGAGRWWLDPVAMGERLEGGCFASARRWISQTPYYTERDVFRRKGGPPRPGRALDKQFHDDVTHLPPFSSAELKSFERFEIEAPRSHPLGLKKHAGVEVTFATPVCGPLAFGYGAHLGLGLLMAYPENDTKT